MSPLAAGADGLPVGGTVNTEKRCIIMEKSMEKKKEQMIDLHYRSKDGITDIYTCMWLPEGKPRGIIQVIHGMIEHIGRYQYFAEALCDQGYIVVGHDQLGHGRSVLSRNDYGFFSKNDPSDTLIRDIHQLRVNMQKRYPDLPYIMVGHSMGSYLLRKYLVFYGKGLSGAVLLGTGFVDPNLTTVGIGITRVLASFKGWKQRSNLIKMLMYNNSYKGYDMTATDLEKSWLSRDIERVKWAYSDPFCRFSFTLNGYLGLFQTVAFSCREKNIRRIPKMLPLLILSGDKDPVGDLGKGVIRFSRLCDKAGIRNKTMKLYGGARHEILNEIDRDVVYEDLLTWLAKVTK